MWIPSHIGIKGNEEVVLLAKSATPNISTIIYKISYKDYHSLYKLDVSIQTKSTVKHRSTIKSTNFFINYYSSVS